MGSQLIPGSSEAAAPKVLSTPASFPYPLVMTQRSPGNSATYRSESLFRSSTRVACSTVVGAPGFNAKGTLGLTWLFQGTKTRALRSFCPLNSNR